MIIGKAIELLKDLLEGLDMPLMTDEADALQLGIEALKRTNFLRTSGSVNPLTLLPGETKE